MTETRHCAICSAPFEFVRQPGRPPEICGAECRRVSARRRHKAWRTRLIATRAKLAEMQARAA